MLFLLPENILHTDIKEHLVRKSNSTDKQILSLIECNNEEVKQENSNKKPVTLTAYKETIWLEKSARI